VTEELLSLLEDFKQKSYSLHEMEALFENWRRKAEVSTWLCWLVTYMYIKESMVKS
jgi:hypothetical protein